MSISHGRCPKHGTPSLSLCLLEIVLSNPEWTRNLTRARHGPSGASWGHPGASWDLLWPPRASWGFLAPPALAIRGNMLDNNFRMSLSASWCTLCCGTTCVVGGRLELHLSRKIIVSPILTPPHPYYLFMPRGHYWILRVGWCCGGAVHTPLANMSVSHHRCRNNDAQAFPMVPRDFMCVSL
jgi:hypothetical protein